MLDLSLGLSLPGLPSLEDEAMRFFADQLEESTQDISGPAMPLMEYIPQAWNIIEPSRPFVDNWHVHAIADHLQGVTAGHIRNLLINIPPGCMKSRLVSVLWPSWEWGPAGRPHYRYLCASYDQLLSTRDNLDVRAIVESDWFQEMWPHLRLKDDQNQKTKFDTTRGGWRMGTSVMGRGTGEHPHRKIVDDPHNVKKAESEVEREQANVFRKRTLATRGVQLRAATIVIMQRLNEGDMSGDIMANEHVQRLVGADCYDEARANLQRDWVHLCLPMRFEEFDPTIEPGEKPVSRRCVTFGSCAAFVKTDDTGKQTVEFDEPSRWADPRKEHGDLLWQEMFPQDEVDKLAADEYLDAGQLQQRPAPAKGGMFKRDWFMVVDAIPAGVRIVARCRGWDAAGTDEEEAKRRKGNKEPAYTVGARLALGSDGIIYVEDIVRQRVGPGDDETLMKTTADADGRLVKIREEQEPGSAGKKVIAAHGKILNGYDYEGVVPQGNKPTRARPFAAQCKLGHVRLIRADWNATFINEFAVFPNGKFKDQVDGTATAHAEIALTPQPTISVAKTTGY